MRRVALLALLAVTACAEAPAPDFLPDTERRSEVVEMDGLSIVVNWIGATPEEATAFAPFDRSDERYLGQAETAIEEATGCAIRRAGGGGRIDGFADGTVSVRLALDCG